MTKAAAISMTQTLAVELAGAGIRVNAIAPGVVETKLAAVLVNTPELAKFFTERAPALGRVGQPEEIAPIMVFFLAGDESSFVTGQSRCDRWGMDNYLIANVPAATRDAPADPQRN